MNLVTRLVVLVSFALAQCVAAGATPVAITPVTAQHGIVVAAHPQAAAAGLAVLKAGGNAIDAAVATSLAIGVAEPYGSGLGGKLLLLYYEAKSGRTFIVEAMDACGSAVDIDTYRKLPEDAHEARRNGPMMSRRRSRWLAKVLKCCPSRGIFSRNRLGNSVAAMRSWPDFICLMMRCPRSDHV
jgi:hypothetical protein